MAGVNKPEHKIGGSRPLPRAANTFLFNRIVRIADASGVEQRHRIAVKIKMYFDYVTRCACIRRYDRRLALGNTIEQRGLSGVRRPRDSDDQTLAQTLTSYRCRK